MRRRVGTAPTYFLGADAAVAAAGPQGADIDFGFGVPFSAP